MARERISDNVKIVKEEDGTLAIECISGDEVYILHLGDPVEFLEEVFRFYLTNWLTNLVTWEKDEFLRKLKKVISMAQKDNTMPFGVYDKTQKKVKEDNDV